MMKKILFTDLDGTLLADDKRIPEINRRAIERMRGEGHKIVLTSGRPTISVLDQAKKLSLNTDGCYVIGFNGAEIADAKTGERLYRNAFESAFLGEIFRHAHAAGLHIQAFDDERVVAERDTEALRRYCKTIGMTSALTEDVTEYFQTAGLTSSKMLVIEWDDTGKLEAFRTRMLAEYGEKMDMVYSSPYYLETIPKGISKGSAVRMLCQILGVPAEVSIGAGDEMNDLPLIQTAHIGCAMANGVEEVKAAADYITQADNNEGGIAEIIEKFIL
ncbi:MAG: HAD family phosphatase [Lachnospiraceae bacterium]|nr:HAD family phosphatase [Lachnospiraceae bacterium]